MLKKERLGKTLMMSCGLNATIIAYRNCNDIDICFEDGKKVHNKQYKLFIKGNIAHPNINNYKSISAQRINSVNIANCGLKCKIVKYINSLDIDVQFEDGTFVTNTRYSYFKSGKIGYPSQDNHHHIDYFYDFQEISFAFKSCGQVFYYCIAPDGERKILTLRQMLEQSGVTPLF